MSEPDTMEPAPVNKDPMLVNGSPVDIQNDIPPLQDPPVVKQPLEPVNGLDHNGLENEDGTPVNGDVHEDLVDDNNLMENEDIEMEGGGESDIVLPPPPEDMSGFPPPLQQQDMDAVDPVSNLETEDNIGELDNEVVEDDLMGESVEGLPPVDNIGVDQVVDDVSEEELVSDEGVNEEHELEKPVSPEPAVVEQPQLIDFGGEQEVPDDIQQPGDNILDSPVPDETGMGLAHELAPEPVPMAPEPVMQEDIPPEPQETVQVEPEPLPIVEPEGSSVDPEPEPQVVPEPEPVCEEPVLDEVEPSSEVATEEVAQPAEEPVPEVIPAVQPEPVKEVVNEPQVEEVSQDVQEPEVSKDVENDYVPSEPVIEQPPDIIAQTTEEPHEVEEAPPPPPPPLVDETPPPPPPLDDSIQLKREHRRSGEVTPKKESPVDPPTVHVHEATPVAVVAPVMKQEPEPSPAPAPVPVPVPQSEPRVAVPAPVEDSDRETGEGQGSVPVSPLSSPARSEGAGSEGALSEPQDLASPQVSQKINKKNFKNKIKFHVDLLEASIKQLSFLSTVNKQTSLQEEWLYKQAIRRYEAFWLPLAAEHKKEHLPAPLDIEWVWHCHMLAPVCYEADCTSLVGKVVDHKIYSEKDRTKALEKSRKYWTAKYPTEPFEIGLVYKEKVEPEPVVESNTAQESEVKDDSIPFVEEGTSEADTKGTL